MPDTTRVAAVLVVGLVIGGGVGFYFATAFAPAKTATITSLSVSTVTSTLAPGGTSGSKSHSGPSPSELLAAINNSVKPNLVLRSYNFGKGSLTAWLLNNDTRGILISTRDIVLNETSTNETQFVLLYPGDVQYGSFVYIPPGGQVTFTVPAVFVTPSVGVLEIMGNHWVLVYGTSKI